MLDVRRFAKANVEVAQFVLAVEGNKINLSRGAALKDQPEKLAKPKVYGCHGATCTVALIVFSGLRAFPVQVAPAP